MYRVMHSDDGQFYTFLWSYATLEFYIQLTVGQLGYLIKLKMQIIFLEAQFLDN